MSLSDVQNAALAITQVTALALPDHISAALPVPVVPAVVVAFHTRVAVLRPNATEVRLRGTGPLSTRAGFRAFRVCRPPARPFARAYVRPREGVKDDD